MSYLPPPQPDRLPRRVHFGALMFLLGLTVIALIAVIGLANSMKFVFSGHETETSAGVDEPDVEARPATPSQAAIMRVQTGSVCGLLLDHEVRAVSDEATIRGDLTGRDSGWCKVLDDGTTPLSVSYEAVDSSQQFARWDQEMDSAVPFDVDGCPAIQGKFTWALVNTCMSPNPTTGEDSVTVIALTGQRLVFVTLDAAGVQEVHLAQKFAKTVALGGPQSVAQAAAGDGSGLDHPVRAPASGSRGH